MQHLILNDSLRMSRLVHGWWRAHEWQLDTDGTLRLIDGLLELGIDTFDHAACYGGFATEGLFGRALAGRSSLRKHLTLVSKCGILFPNDTLPGIGSAHYDNTRDHIVWSAQRSVQQLQCEYLDLLLIHRPSPCAHPDEIAAAFDALQARGLVRHFGVSNYPAHKLRMLQSRVRQPLVTNQIEISPLHLAPFEDGTLDHLLETRRNPMAWSPLAGGRLFDPDDERAGRVRRALLAVGEKHDETRIDTLTYAWLLNHPAGIIPIVGSSQIGRVRHAVDAQSIRFSEEDWLRVYVASQGFPLP
ncbi:MAG: aldo/keto reductase [Lautropia sp.]|nr:aldo/keto reductase [Lautropia sp.]